MDGKRGLICRGTKEQRIISLNKARAYPLQGTHEQSKSIKKELILYKVQTSNPNQ